MDEKTKKAVYRRYAIREVVTLIDLWKISLKELRAEFENDAKWNKSPPTWKDEQ